MEVDVAASLMDDEEDDLPSGDSRGLATKTKKTTGLTKRGSRKRTTNKKK